MPSLVDPNQVRFTGENSFLRLKDSAEGPDTTVCAHWRCLYSPAGGGHALFVRSGAIDDEVKVFSNNPGLARFVQQIEALFRPFFAAPDLPIVESTFAREGDYRTAYSEIVESAEGRIQLTWRDLGEPFQIAIPPGSDMTGSWGVFSCLIPAAAGEASILGRTPAGTPYPEDMDGHPSSTSCLAWSETWVHPR